MMEWKEVNTKLEMEKKALSFSNMSRYYQKLCTNMLSL